MKDIEFLKENSEKFYKYAVESFKNGDYNISAFNLEQSVQFYLKYVLATLLMDFPKTHYLRELINSVIRVTGSDNLKNFLQENENLIANLEDAYITSRYFPSKFTENQVAHMISITDKLREILKEIAKTEKNK